MTAGALRPRRISQLGHSATWPCPGKFCSYHYWKSFRHLTGSRSVRRASLVERIEGSGMHEGRLHL